MSQQTIGSFVLIAALAACGGKAVESESNANPSGGAPSFGGSASISGAGADAAAGSNPVADAGSATMDAGCFNAALGCGLTASDVSCLSDADCTTLVIPGCGESAIVGVNLQGASHARCVAPPCAPPPPDNPDNPACTACFQVQDCSSLSDPKQAQVRCVADQCRTSYYCPLCLR